MNHCRPSLVDVTISVLGKYEPYVSFVVVLLCLVRCVVSEKQLPTYTYISQTSPLALLVSFNRGSEMHDITTQVFFFLEWETTRLISFRFRGFIALSAAGWKPKISALMNMAQSTLDGILEFWTIQTTLS